MKGGIAGVKKMWRWVGEGLDGKRGKGREERKTYRKGMSFLGKDVDVFDAVLGCGLCHGVD